MRTQFGNLAGKREFLSTLLTHLRHQIGIFFHPFRQLLIRGNQLLLLQEAHQSLVDIGKSLLLRLDLARELCQQAAGVLVI